MTFFKRTVYRILDPKPVVTRHGIATPTLVKAKGRQIEVVFLID